MLTHNDGAVELTISEGYYHPAAHLDARLHVSWQRIGEGIAQREWKHYICISGHGRNYSKETGETHLT